ncbi:MAG TPA: hypothetical protein VK196_21940, partial [Magnetospirillum sp.]|nr:hypothetical protein [Magnetospirillum sp.]
GRLSSSRLSDEAALGGALADLTASLDQLAVAGQSLAEGLAPLDTGGTAALGSVGQEGWRQGVERLSANQAKAAAKAMAFKVPGLGPLFKSGRNERPELAPAVRAAATTMRALAQANFHSVPASTMPELGSLALRNSSPDPRRIAGADERLAEYRTWLKSGSGTVPEAVLRPVVDVVAFQVALAVVMDVAAAYQADLPEDEGVLPADIVASVVSGLDAIDHGMAGDVAWLIGVRAYRRLEAIDTAYERANPFHLSGVVREWSGERPILDVVGWKTADERRHRLSDGLRAVRDHRSELDDLLRILSVPLVAAELTDPRLVQKWRHLTLAASDPDGPGAAGYRALRTLIVDRLAGFRAADCSHLDALPRVPSRPGDPFAAEMSDIVRALSDRCAFLRHPPQSGPHTPPPPIPGD